MRENVELRKLVVEFYDRNMKIEEKIEDLLKYINDLELENQNL